MDDTNERNVFLRNLYDFEVICHFVLGCGLYNQRLFCKFIEFQIIIIKF